MHATLLAFWLALQLLLSTPARAGEPLRFGTFQNSQSPILHICEQVLREAYASLGHMIKVVHLPAERSLYWAANGRLDGELCRAQASDALLLVPAPVYYWQLAAFSIKPLPVQSWQDLHPYKIAYERGMRVISAHHGLNLVPANSIQSGILLLQKNRVDILLDEYNSVLYAAHNMNIDGLQGHQQIVDRGPLHHLLNKKHAALARQLDGVLTQMGSSGRIDQIAQTVMEDFRLPATPEHTLQTWASQ